MWTRAVNVGAQSDLPPGPHYEYAGRGCRSAKSVKRVHPGGRHFWHLVTEGRVKKPDGKKKLCSWVRLVPLASAKTHRLEVPIRRLSPPPIKCSK